MAGFLGRWFGVEPYTNDQNPNPAGAVAAPYSPTTQEQPHASSINSYTQNMKGLINNTGYTKGDGNGSINCPLGIPVAVGFVLERQTEHQNIKGLTNQTGSIKGNTNGLINLGTFEAQPGPNDSPQQSEEDQGIPKPTSQNIKGLTNQTGFVKGHGNGVINLGTFETQSRP